MIAGAAMSDAATRLISLRLVIIFTPFFFGKADEFFEGRSPAAASRLRLGDAGMAGGGGGSAIGAAAVCVRRGV
jgi:hypothetical protein